MFSLLNLRKQEKTKSEPQQQKTKLEIQQEIDKITLGAHENCDIMFVCFGNREEEPLFGCYDCGFRDDCNKCKRLERELFLM